MSLEVFIPTPRKLTIADEDFAILPLRMKQVPGFAKVLHPLMPLLLAGKLNQAIIEYTDNLAEAIVIATGKDLDWALALYPHDFMALIGAILEVNTDFFTRHVFPQIRVASQMVTTITKDSGGEPS